MIRTLEERDYSQSLQLSEYAFQYKLSEEEREQRREQMGDQKIFGIFHDDHLAAKLHLMPFQTWFGERMIPMGGVAGVATYPEYRRNGYVRKLLLHSLEAMKEAGQFISMLHPFYIDFYRKFGWEVFASYRQMTVDQKDLSPLSTATGTIRREGVTKEVMEAYDRYAKKHNGMLVRTDSWWKKKEDQWHVATYHADEMEGYILYTISEGVMTVDEFLPLTPAARKGLWNFICQHDSMVLTVKVKLAEGEVLPLMLKNPRIKVEDYPYFMARVVDVEPFLKTYLRNKETFEAFTLKVVDQHAPWNSAVWHLSMNGVERRDGSPADVEVGIKELSAFTFGFLSAADLEAMGHIDAGEVACLESIRTTRQTCFQDFF
ncbi:GNAT family N-acetyltransferase [Rossellomorea marisflavi]|uniref:GNAT family N-acetyltransferase n=1 Tax=Rossellomorea marisflavi TaxID=189381 RepID=UPI0027A87750|nr:GNAT family N-acetyltransferase [Rossellomorea marisflavi]UTE71213.1 GNAT family N-acetyltransferase [Rossellomorea marisflavi]